MYISNRTCSQKHLSGQEQFIYISKSKHEKVLVKDFKSCSKE